MGLAWACFAAGVPAVVASLWRSEDDLTAQLMDTFYERLRLGDDPFQALRKAQVQFIDDNEPASYNWAAFQMMGAAGSFHFPDN
jgi:CHAT domain-containing protein